MEKPKDLGKTVKTVSKLGDKLSTAGKMLLSTFLGTLSDEGKKDLEETINEVADDLNS